MLYARSACILKRVLRVDKKHKYAQILIFH